MTHRLRLLLITGLALGALGSPTAALAQTKLIANVGLNAEGVIGAWPLPLFPDSGHPDMVKFREAWAKRVVIP